MINPLPGWARGFFLFEPKTRYNKSMELDYEVKHWTRPCPQVDCRKKVDWGLDYIEIPAALTEEMSPKNGAFANAIVKYNDTGEIWIYSKDGVPVKIKEGE